MFESLQTDQNQSEGSREASLSSFEQMAEHPVRQPISAIGSNLWIIRKSLPYADPESGMTAGNIQGYSTGSLPTTRDFSFNLKLNF